MVAIPQLPDPIMTTEAPTPAISPGEVQQSGDNIARGMSKLGQGLEDFGTPLAQQAGEQAGHQAVTRNADGSLKVTPAASSFILNPRMTDAYEKGVADAQGPALRSNIDADMAKTANDYRADPQEMRRQMGIYTDNLRAQYPGPVGAAASTYAQGIGSQHYLGALNTVSATQANDAINTSKDRRSLLDQQMTTLAEQPGGTETPQFQQMRDERNSIGQNLVGNPLSGYSADKRDLDDKQFASKLSGAQVDASIDTTMAGPDGKAKALGLLNDHILNNPDLSDADRAELYQRGRARIEVLSGLQSANIQQNGPTVTLAVAKLAGGLNPEDPAIQAAIDHSTAIGDADGAASISAMRELRRRTAGTAGLSDNATLAMHGITPPNYGGYYNTLLGKESGGGQNIGNPTSSAFGPAQITTGTWASVIKAHPELGLTMQDRMNPAAQMRVLPVLTADNRAFLQKSGVEANDKNTYLAHFMGAQGAVNFIKAAQANPNAAAAALFPAEANANQSIFYDPKTMQSRTLADVYSRQTSRFSGNATVGAPSVNGNPFTPEEMAANPFLTSAYLRAVSSDAGSRVASTKELVAAVNKGIDGGIAPSPQNVAQIYQMGQQYPDKLGDDASALKARIEGGGAGDVAANMAPAQGQAYVGAINAGAQGADIYQGRVAMAAKQEFQARQAALVADPAGEALRRKWITNLPVPLNPADPSSFAPAIAQRGMVAGTIASHNQDPEQGIFAKAELGAPTSIIANGSVEQKLALLTPLTQLPAPIRDATFAQLGVKDAAGQTFAMAGDVAARGGDAGPAAARSILNGQQLLQQEPRFGLKKEDLQTNFAKSLPPNDFPDGTLRSTIMSAAQAYYATLSSQANDTSQGFNQGRWDTAIGAVTGGVINYRGSNIIAPAYGATSSDFGQMINGLTDKDLAGAVHSDGSPILASELKSSSFGASNPLRLQSVGDGRYVMFSGDDAARQITKGSDGHSFVLDLNGRAVPNALATAPRIGDGGSLMTLAPQMLSNPMAPQPDDMTPLGRARDRLAPIQLPTGQP